MASLRNVIQNLFAWYFRSIARFLIWRQKPVVVTITGSVGKTSTKDVLLAQLQTVTTAGGTIRSQNSELTTPLSILGIEIKNRERNMIVWVKLFFVGMYKCFFCKLPHVLVLEVGAGGPGDITAVCTWLKSDFAVFTALAKNPVHVDHFQSREQLFEEKKQLALLSKKSATLVFPEDDQFLEQLLADVERKKISISKTDISQIQCNSQGTKITFTNDSFVQINGVWSNVISQSYLTGLQIAKELNFDIKTINNNFSQYYVPTPGRARLLEGINGSIIIDDSYNASPVAVTASLQVFKDAPIVGRKIFVFGDMKELGEYTEDAHKTVAHEAQNFVDVVLTVGDESKITHDELIVNGFSNSQAIHFETSVDAGKWLLENIQEGDAILAKSSRHAIRMELALKQIVRDDQRQFLVQEYL